MIRMFPLLVDSTISANIIPGICKVLERYLIVYKLDDLIAMSRFGGSAGQIIGGTGKKLVDGISGSLDSIIPGMSAARKMNEQTERDKLEKEKFEYQKERDIEKAEAEKEEKKKEKGKKDLEKEKWETEKEKLQATVKIDTHEIKSNLSLEPTWLTIQGSAGTMLLGVKVFPVPITNPQDYIAQLMTDKGLKTFERIVLSTGNSLIRSFRAIMRGALRKPLRWFGITFPEISGDPFDDIILGKSKFGQNTMLLLNYANIKDDEIFMDAGGLDKLFALGWSSVLIADEVAKKLIFCMKEFYGHCSFVPYSFIYQSMGSEAMRAYQDLEAAKKSMSPFQQQKVDASKFFGESLAQENLKKYIGLNLPCLKEDCK